MFTLIRPVAAVFLAIFAYFAAVAYEPLFAPDADLGTTYIWYAVRVAFVIGWVFLGGQLGKALWYSVYAAVQAVVLTAIATAMVLAVGEVFILGYRRRYSEVTDALTGYVEIVIDWLTRALVPEYLLLLAAGGVVIGVLLHGIHILMERRRNDR